MDHYANLMWPFSKKSPKPKNAFRVSEAPMKLRGRLRADIESLPPFDSFNLLMDFYNDSRAIDAMAVKDDGDMLLFQWGLVDRGNDKNFEISLTRQLIVTDGEDDDIWQLQLSYFYIPHEEYHPTSSGDKWCPDPIGLPSFRDFVFNTPSFAFFSRQSAKLVELHWEQV